MKALKVSDNTFFIRLEEGEDIFQTVSTFIINHNIVSGEIRGIGSLKQYSLGYYDGEKYLANSEKEHVELVSLQGNISLKDGSPFPHMHAIISKKDGSCKGGHVMENNIVSYVVELIITEFKEKVYRKEDEKTGLSLWDLPAEQLTTTKKLDEWA